ncbi:MAG: fibronectin type III domain-containing protein [Firmicutes bacterium]|nr:fibronectin type III domain-containing protein [Bacillota bacterium]
MSSFLTRFGGVTAAASGVIGILQMSGIIKDPTQVALGEILQTVKDIQTQLNEMDQKLDDINKQLVSIAVRQEEKDRNNKATTMLKYWRDFNTQYSEPLDNKINEYKGKINEGIRAWWKESSHDGVRLLYTDGGVKKDTIIDGYILTYSRNAYNDGFPDVSDNGDVVSRVFSIGVPGEWIPDTANMTFNINSYQEDFEAKMTENFIQAADQKKLDARTIWWMVWEGASQEYKTRLAKKYAHEIMNTLLYHIACDTMSDNDAWVISVTNAYENYCKNILEQDSGVNAMLNAMYLTHGFEGEIKQDITDFCDKMAVKAGVYGEFALTCAGQDSLQSITNRQEIQALFADTVTSLYDKKDKALTGHDNYCYVTGTLVEHAKIYAESSLTMKNKSGGYRGYEKTDWKITVPNILDNVYTQVLFNQYKSLPQGAGSFASYLKLYGAFPTDNWTGNIMTRYGGAQDFAFSEGIRMKAIGTQHPGSYFKDNQYYNIDVGTGSKVEQKYYHVHDKVVCDYFNMGSGNLSVNQTAAARAFYGEDHWNWVVDEVWAFETDSCHYWRIINQKSGVDWTEIHNRVGFDILKLTPVHDLNGYEDPEDPFFAFDQATLTRGVSDWIGPTYQDTETAITDVVLEKESYTYTGKPIKPYATIMAGKKKVPLDSFKVTYGENRELGLGEITVEGAGDYSGTIHKTFNIIPKGTSLSKLKKKKNTVTVKWKKQAEIMPDTEIDGYQIRYSTNKSMKGAKKLTVKGYKKTSKKIKGLKKNKKYYFQIRTYVKSSKGNLYSQWSSKKSVKTK